ncbi:MAG: DNA recombination protein RmuC [Planctomycetes bacterium]|nr:DNA recombination protein RmuC [Planctomycetota bacterium]
MDPLALTVGAAVGLALGAAAGWSIARLRSAGAEARLAQALADLDASRARGDDLSRRVTELVEQRARLEAALEHERTAVEEKLALLKQAQDTLKNDFKALSADALRNNNRSFLDLAASELEKRETAVASLTTPIRESLAEVNRRIEEIEKARNEAYGSLSQEVKNLASLQQLVTESTNRLSRALSSPNIRGRWGEIQLRNVVEMADMLQYCDFVEQPTVASESGRLRPDMIVRLPGGGTVVVDSKTPLDAYFSAVKADDDSARKQFLSRHVQALRDHMKTLGAKSYWEQFDPAPDFVIMFLPAESFLTSALQHDPALIQSGVDNRVLPASPVTLIALLRAVAFGWRQEQLAEGAREISALGSELYDRLGTLASHFAGVGGALSSAVDVYNKSIGSLERRVLPTARRFRDLGVTPKPVIESPGRIDAAVRRIQADELKSLPVEPGDDDASSGGPAPQDGLF